MNCLLALLLSVCTSNGLDLVWNKSLDDDGSTNFEYRVYSYVERSNWVKVVTTQTNYATVNIGRGLNLFYVTLAMVDDSDESPPSNVLVVSRPHIEVGTLRIR